MPDIFENYISVLKKEKEEIGTFRNGKIDFNCRFQHVIQRAYRRRNLLSGEVGWQYHTVIESKFPEYEVLLLCQVVMPNHVHEIYYAPDVRNISKFRAAACRQATVIMKHYRASKNQSPVERLFDPDPGYVAIKNTRQLLITMKYLRDNDKYLRETGEKVPFSCFEYWEKQYYKPYPADLMSELFGFPFSKLCGYMNMEMKDVVRVADTYLSDRIVERDKKVFFSV